MNILQGVTLTDLREAQKTDSLPPQDRQTEDGGTLNDRSCLRKDFTDERRVKVGTETTESSPKWIRLDEVNKRENSAQMNSAFLQQGYLVCNFGGCFLRKINFSYACTAGKRRTQAGNPH